ncbi:MAG TPA: aldo/keto reductase [Acidobacteriota bacterium]|nr:aldo/keto reductase [Acidobacteriota bacterium]
MKLDLRTRVTLNNGVKMPLFGLGTWAATGSEGRRAVLWALEAGYRLIDTASSYGNESEVGQAVRASGLPRDEIFITTKVWPAEFGYESTLRAFEASRERLGVERVDLYLIHWPGDDRRLRAETWRALEKLSADGRCRAIGVSNYEVAELAGIIETGDARNVPAVNQVPFSPFRQQREVHVYCGLHGIRLEGYSPLTRGSKLGHPAVRALAKAHGRTPAQIMLRWALQKEVVTIPKSVHKARIIENASVFDFSLSPQDTAALDDLDGRR